MSRPLSLLAVAVLALCACNGDRTAGGDQAASATSAPAIESPAAATAPPPVAPAAVVTTPARFDGYAGLRFGMTAAEARRAWDGTLKPVPDDREACYYLTPLSARVPADFALMIENDRFVRYDIGTADQTAPGGGKVGMDVARIEQLYAGRVEQRPHKYVEGGQYLRIRDPAGDGVLVFETDAGGKVTRWRAGLAPQVDYIEGCA